MKKQVLVVDIDDVLSASAAGFAEYSNNKWGSGITAEDYQEEWALVWKVSQEVASERALQLHADGIVADYGRIEGAYDALQELTQQYRLVNVTSRRLSIKSHTDSWLESHFPNIFERTVYAGIWDKDHPSGIRERLQSTKTAICLELGASYIIDDQIKHCLSAAESGVKAILFGNYPWNSTDEPTHPYVTRKANWREVLEYLKHAS